jgi:nickel-type superoxide dismutase maturation protease
VIAIREGWMRWPLWRVAVAERSMEPVLRPGDWLLVRRSMRRGDWLLVRRRGRDGRPPRIRPGQVVIARHPGRPDLLLVKRVARREPGGWWLESDNPGAGAVDSRMFGVVPPGLIEGRVLLRYWPLRRRAGP